MHVKIYFHAATQDELRLQTAYYYIQYKGKILLNSEKWFDWTCASKTVHYVHNHIQYYANIYAKIKKGQNSQEKMDSKYP